MTTVRPAFLDNLTAPDFKAVASQGCFVYCYLRTACGTPYYVGIAKRWKRPIEKDHSCVVPRDRSRIRVLRSGMTWEDACEWERYYIARWGRQNNDTGILRNFKEGGEGAVGYIHSAESLAKMSAAHKGKPKSVETRARMSAALMGHTFSPETIEKMSAKAKKP